MTTVVVANRTTTGSTTITTTSNNETESSKKRRIDQSEDDTRWAKGGEPKGNPTTIMRTSLLSDSNTESRIQFLKVHFDIVQAMYHKNNNPTEENNDCSPSLLSRKSDDPLGDTEHQRNNFHQPLQKNSEEDNVPIWDDTNIWSHIQSFLTHQRELLLQIQHRIDHISKLHQASLECCSVTTTATVIDNGTGHDASFSSLIKTSTNDSSFRIIANIIGQQSKVIKQQKHVPSIVVLQQLLHEVTRRIEELQDVSAKQFQQKQIYFIENRKDMDIEKQNRTAIPPKRSSTTCNDSSYRTEIQYKIQLWSLLAHDLKEVLRD